MPVPDAGEDRRFTYEDYLTWPSEPRYELLGGVAHMLASPSSEHQETLMELAFYIRGGLGESNCRVYAAPMDLCFEESPTAEDVVQPDLFVMCGSYRTGPRIIGVPVWIVEILSPSTASRDKIAKMDRYQRAGIQEYWIVDPLNRVMDVFLHDGERWVFRRAYGPDDEASTLMRPSLTIPLKHIFSPSPA